MEIFIAYIAINNMIKMKKNFNDEDFAHLNNNSLSK